MKMIAMLVDHIPSSGMKKIVKIKKLNNSLEVFMFFTENSLRAKYPALITVTEEKILLSNDGKKFKKINSLPVFSGSFPEKWETELRKINRPVSVVPEIRYNMWEAAMKVADPQEQANKLIDACGRAMSYMEKKMFLYTAMPTSKFIAFYKTQE